MFSVGDDGALQISARRPIEVLQQPNPGQLHLDGRHDQFTGFQLADDGTALYWNREIGLWIQMPDSGDRGGPANSGGRKELLEIPRHAGEITSAAIRRDGSEVAWADDQGVLRIQNARTGAKKHEAKLKLETSETIDGLEFVPDSTRLLLSTLGTSRRLRLYDISEQRFVDGFSQKDAVYRRGGSVEFACIRSGRAPGIAPERADPRRANCPRTDRVARKFQ